MRTKIPEGLSCPITPEQSYPSGVPDIPDGWEFVRFSNAYSLTDEEHVLLNVNGVGAPIKPRSQEDRYRHWVVVRRKPTPPKPKECKGRGSCMISPGEHCPCEDRCCFCHYEQQLPSKPARPRRFEVVLNQNDMDMVDGNRAPDCKILLAVEKKDVREIKPITREQVLEGWSVFSGRPMGLKSIPDGLTFALKYLGIEVED